MGGKEEDEEEEDEEDEAKHIQKYERAEGCMQLACLPRRGRGKSGQRRLRHVKGEGKFRMSDGAFLKMADRLINRGYRT